MCDWKAAKCMKSMIHVGKVQTRQLNNLTRAQDQGSWNPTSVNKKSFVLWPNLMGTVFMYQIINL